MEDWKGLREKQGYYLPEDSDFADFDHETAAPIPEGIGLFLIRISRKQWLRRLTGNC